jgi:carbamoyltransferase
MNILGINTYHADSAACLPVDGRIAAAAEGGAVSPRQALGGVSGRGNPLVPADQGLELADLAHVAINSDPAAHRLRKLGYLATHLPDPRSVMQRNRRERVAVADKLARAFPGRSLCAPLHFVEHQYAHLCSAFHCSPFERVVVVSVEVEVEVWRLCQRRLGRG